MLVAVALAWVRDCLVAVRERVAVLRGVLLGASALVTLALLPGADELVA